MLDTQLTASLTILPRFVAGSVIRKNRPHPDSVLIIPRHSEPKKFYRRCRSFIRRDRCIWPRDVPATQTWRHSKPFFLRFTWRVPAFPSTSCRKFGILMTVQPSSPPAGCCLPLHALTDLRIVNNLLKHYSKSLRKLSSSVVSCVTTAEALSRRSRRSACGAPRSCPGGHVARSVQCSLKADGSAHAHNARVPAGERGPMMTGRQTGPHPRA